MDLVKTSILGVDVTTNLKEEILTFCSRYLFSSIKLTTHNSQLTTDPLVIVTPNPEQVVLARQNKAFADILKQADIALPDGTGLIFASRLLTMNDQRLTNSRLTRISGIDFMEDLCNIASNQRIPIALIGGRGGVAVKSLDCLQKKYLGLKGWGEDRIEFSESFYVHRLSESTKRLTMNEERSTQFKKQEAYMQRVITEIRRRRIGIVFVGLGAPKQEFFIQYLHDVLLTMNDKLILMSVGGSFDELSGRIPRPPKFIDQLGLKWLWRLILEPRRWRRQVALLKFVYLVFRERLRSI